MKLPGISNLIEKRAKERGYEGNLKNDIAFLARFFNKENKETRRKLTGDKPEKKSRKKKRTLEEGTFGNQEHQQIINSIFTLFQKEKQTLNALQNCVHQVNIQTFNLAQDTTKDDVCKKVQEKQNNVYVISDETYFAQATCILFTLYVFEELYGPNGKK